MRETNAGSTEGPRQPDASSLTVAPADAGEVRRFFARTAARACASALPIGRQQFCAPRPPAWPIAPGSGRAHDEARESAHRSLLARSPTSMAHDDRLGGPSDHNTTAETPWPRRESREPGAGERWSRCHRSPAAARPAPLIEASSRARRRVARARVTEGARGRRDASPGHALGRVSSAALPAARHPTSDTIRGTHRAWRRTRIATGPARSGTHAACGAPRRHTMPSAQAAGKRGRGAGRTSVSQSLRLTGHSVRRTFAEGVAHVGTIGDFPSKLARPAGFEPATPGLEGRCSIQLSYGRTLYSLESTETG